MLHRIEINVPKKAKWGASFSRDFVLPSKIGRITGVVANVVLPRTSVVKRLVLRKVENIGQQPSADENQPAVTYSLSLGNALTAQIGSVSVVLNKTETLVAATPAFATNLLSHKSIGRNIKRLGRPIAVCGGSTLTVTMEEKLLTPFVDKSTFDDTNGEDQEIEKLYKKEFGSVRNFKNEYKLNIYIEYDK